MCKAGKITIAEVEEIVEVGELDPNHIHVPGVYVQRVVKGEAYEKRIEVIIEIKPINFVKIVKKILECAEVDPEESSFE
jgi:acyl CoA:acetate/3-ketoacid CoA transferase